MAVQGELRHRVSGGRGRVATMTNSVGTRRVYQQQGLVRKRKRTRRTKTIRMKAVRVFLLGLGLSETAVVVFV